VSKAAGRSIGLPCIAHPTADPARLVTLPTHRRGGPRPRLPAAVRRTCTLDRVAYPGVSTARGGYDFPELRWQQVPAPIDAEA